MAAQKKKKSKRQHSFLLTVFFISIVVIFVISLVSLKKEIDKRTAEKEEVSAMYSQQEAENKELQSIVDSSNKDEQMEKEARKKGYIKPGDVVYEDIADGE